MSRAETNWRRASAAREFVFTVLESAFVLAILKHFSDEPGLSFFDVAYGLGYLSVLLYSLFAGEHVTNVLLGKSEEEVDGKWARLGFRQVSMLLALVFAVFSIMAIDAVVEAGIAELKS